MTCLDKYTDNEIDKPPCKNVLYLFQNDSDNNMTIQMISI